ncbi:MAG: hypothetical protein KDK07_21925 [Bauldia sp.]|nr:hypothetical protein [Bauldia sp.]
MNRSTVFATASGRMVDLLAPRPEDIDLCDVAEQLAKEPRFNGAPPGEAYSVGQHVCLGADALLERTGNWLAAAYFLLHDGHEFALKDDTTPKKRALDAIASEHFGVLSGRIMAAFAELTDRWDAAIHAAAGLAWPPPDDVARIVKHFDAVMLATEWRDLMQIPPPYDFGVKPLRRRIAGAWDWRLAKAEFIDRVLVLLPDRRTAASRAAGPSLPPASACPGLDPGGEPEGGPGEGSAP